MKNCNQCQVPIRGDYRIIISNDIHKRTLCLYCYNGRVTLFGDSGYEKMWQEKVSDEPKAPTVWKEIRVDGSILIMEEE